MGSEFDRTFYTKIGWAVNLTVYVDWERDDHLGEITLMPYDAHFLDRGWVTFRFKLGKFKFGKFWI